MSIESGQGISHKRQMNNSCRATHRLSNLGKPLRKGKPKNPGCSLCSCLTKRTERAVLFAPRSGETR
jgi:hypothetical protein